jgi:hypothetical protein
MNESNLTAESKPRSEWRFQLLSSIPMLIGIAVVFALGWYTCLGLFGLYLAIAMPIGIYQWYFVRCPRCKIRGFRSIYAIQGKGHASVCVQHCRHCNLCLVQHRDGEVEVPFEGFEESAGRIFHGERPLSQT